MMELVPVRYACAPGWWGALDPATGAAYYYKADGFSGQSLWVELSSSATVLDLKREMRARHGIRVSMIVVFLRSTVLELSLIHI